MPRKCPCCGGPTRWTMNGKSMECDGCKRALCYAEPTCNNKEANR